MNTRALFYRKLDDGREQLTGPVPITFIGTFIFFITFLFFRTHTEPMSDTRLSGGGVNMEQTAISSTSYDEVRVTDNSEQQEGLNSLRGFDLLEKPKDDRKPAYKNQIVDSLNADVTRVYNNESLGGDPRYQGSGMMGDDSDYLSSLLYGNKVEGIELNDRLDLLMSATGCKKIETGKYITQRGRNIFPKDYKNIQSLLEDIGFESIGNGRYVNSIGVIVDFEKENFKGGTQIEGLYFINSLSGEMIKKEVIATLEPGTILTPDGIDVTIDTNGVLYDGNDRFTNIKNEGEFLAPDGKRYAIKKTSLSASVPINPNPQRNQKGASDPLIIYGTTIPTQSPTNDVDSAYETGKYLPKGFRLPVVLLSPYRSDIQTPMLIFAAYRDITAYGKLQIPMGTRFIAKATVDEGSSRQLGGISSTTSVPPGDRIQFTVKSILYPDGSEIAMSGVVLDANYMTGLKGYYIPLPAYVQAYPLMSELAVSFLQRLALGDTENAQSIVLGGDAGTFTLSEGQSASDGTINASISAVREFSNRYTQVLYQRNQPHVKLPAGERAFIQILDNVDLTNPIPPFSNGNSEYGTIEDNLQTITAPLPTQSAGVTLNSDPDIRQYAPSPANMNTGTPSINTPPASPEQSFFGN